MRSYLLDTNIVSDMIKHGVDSVVLEHIERVGAPNVYTSVIVSGELHYGARKKGSEALTRRVIDVLRRLAVLPYERPSDEVYGRVRADLESLGTPIGGNDLLIAAQCIAIGATLVTDNEREFKRVTGLHVENWLRR